MTSLTDLEVDALLRFEVWWREDRFDWPHPSTPIYEMALDTLLAADLAPETRETLAAAHPWLVELPPTAPLPAQGAWEGEERFDQNLLEHLIDRLWAAWCQRTGAPNDTACRHCGGRLILAPGHPISCLVCDWKEPPW